MVIEIPKIDKTKYTPETEILYNFIVKQNEEIRKQAEIIEILKEEINRLKKHKGKPNIKPSNIEKRKKNKNSHKLNKINQSKKNPPKQETIVIKAEGVTAGSKFKGYQDYNIQELVIEAKIIKYRLERWELPNGKYVVAKLPTAIKGSHFGPTLRSYIEYQNNLGVTEPQIAEELRGFGIEISTGEINRILVENKEDYHKEKDDILKAGLKVSKYINVDDTGARHKGKNGYCTHIGNELFAWFGSTESKSRINFLELLRGGNKDYIIDDNALDYMKREKLPKEKLELLRIDKKTFGNKEEFVNYLNEINVTNKRLAKIVTEGALVGSVLLHGFSIDTKIISDDAGQFNIFKHALCWIHAERAINRLVPLHEQHARDIEKVLSIFWKIYNNLKAYKRCPAPKKAKRITKCFDKLCSMKTSYQLLNKALNKLKENKTELLLVLEYPEIPLHNNLSENDIRDYVKKRKISGGTRSVLGRKYRDTFMSLKKTCRKLGVNFWEYLLDRNNKANTIPYLPTLIQKAALINSS